MSGDGNPNLRRHLARPPNAARSLSTASPYRILDIPTHANKEEIKQRFRALARVHHPDRGGDPEIMASIVSAYSDLMDDEFSGPVLDSRIALSVEAFSIQELAMDGLHDVFELALTLDALIGGTDDTATKTPSHDRPAMGTPCQPPDSSICEDTPLEEIQRESSYGVVAREEQLPRFASHATSYDSVADLKRSLESQFGVTWGLSGRRQDREGLSIGWEVVIESREEGGACGRSGAVVLCPHFFLNDYNLTSRHAKLYVVIRR